jgi:hypothetical protein
MMVVSEGVMHIIDSSEVLEQITPDHKYWYGARIVMSPLPRVETLWRNPELAGVWVFTFSTTRECVRAILDTWFFSEDPKLHRVSPVLEWKG